MEKSYRACALFIFFSLIGVGCNQSLGRDLEYDDDDEAPDVIYYEAPDDWIGPGFYYGIWFGDEGELNDYHDRYYNHHDRDRDRDDRDSHRHRENSTPRGQGHRGSGRGR